MRTCGKPSAMSRSSGRSLATVNTFVVHAAMRTPVTLIAVARAMAPIMVIARPAGVATGGASTPTYTMRMFSAAAQARSRETSREPADLKSDDRAECLARVEIGAARLVEAAAHLREAQKDDEDTRAGDEHRQRTPRAGERGDRRRHAEDAAADHAVDDGRRQAPAAHGANQRWLTHGSRRCSPCERYSFRVA